MVNFKNFIVYILQFFRQTPKISQNAPAKETVSHKITLQKNV